MKEPSKALWKARELLIRNCNRLDVCRDCEFYSEEFCLVNVPSNWVYTDKQEWEMHEHGEN